MKEQPSRPRYEVTLVVHPTPRSIVMTKYGDSPEHAIYKAKRDLGPGYEVVSATATVVAEGER